MRGLSGRLINAARALRRALEGMEFAPPVAHVYDPLVYAWEPYTQYLRRYADTRKRVVFLGMNPGPFGMVQTGVPFGEVGMVRDWLGILANVERPHCEHPKRPVLGFECGRSEVSGLRLWGLFATRFGKPEKFFTEHLVVNYCPLAFLESSGRNRTPDKLPPSERAVLFAHCDSHLRAVIKVLDPEWVVAVGDFAYRRAQAVFNGESPRLGRILHPSPASPTANRGWARLATAQLQDQGVWTADHLVTDH